MKSRGLENHACGVYESERVLLDTHARIQVYESERVLLDTHARIHTQPPPPLPHTHLERRWMAACCSSDGSALPGVKTAATSMRMNCECWMGETAKDASSLNARRGGGGGEAEESG